MSAHLHLAWDADSGKFRPAAPSYREIIDAAHRERAEALTRYEAQERRKMHWQDRLALVGLGLCVMAVLVITTMALSGAR